MLGRTLREGQFAASHLVCGLHYVYSLGPRPKEPDSPDPPITWFEYLGFDRLTAERGGNDPGQGFAEDVPLGATLPEGQLIARFRHYGRQDGQVMLALSDGTSRPTRKGELLDYGAGMTLCECVTPCRTREVAAGLVWLLRRLFGAPEVLAVSPGAVEEAVDVAEAWNLIARNKSGSQGVSLTPAGVVWTLAESRHRGIELDASAAPKQAIQNIIHGGNVNQNFGQQYGVNLGTQYGPVASGPSAMSVQGDSATASSHLTTNHAADQDLLAKALDLVNHNRELLRLNSDQLAQLQRAMADVTEALSRKNLDGPATRNACRTILHFAAGLLQNLGASAMLDVLKTIAN